MILYSSKRLAKVSPGSCDSCHDFPPECGNWPILDWDLHSYWKQRWIVMIMSLVQKALYMLCLRCCMATQFNHPTQRFFVIKLPKRMILISAQCAEHLLTDWNTQQTCLIKFQCWDRIVSILKSENTSEEAFSFYCWFKMPISTKFWQIVLRLVDETNTCHQFLQYFILY